MKLQKSISILLLSIILFACGNSDNTPKTPKDILTGSEWLIAESYVKRTEQVKNQPLTTLLEGNAVTTLPLCVSDNFIRFRADNLWETYTGTMKCPNEPTVSPLARGGYELSTDGKTFTWRDVATGSTAWYTAADVTTNTKVNKLTADYFEFEKTIEVTISADTKQVHYWRWGYKKK